MRPRPAVRIVFAPLARRNRSKQEAAEGTQIGGLAHKAERTIKLDPRLDQVGRTLLHELLHVRHPKWEEAKVAAEEELRWTRMGWREKARLYQMLGSARLEGEE